MRRRDLTKPDGFVLDLERGYWASQKDLEEQEGIEATKCPAMWQGSFPMSRTGEIACCSNPSQLATKNLWPLFKQQCRTEEMSNNVARVIPTLKTGATVFSLSLARSR